MGALQIYIDDDDDDEFTCNSYFLETGSKKDKELMIHEKLNFTKLNSDTVNQTTVLHFDTVDTYTRVAVLSLMSRRNTAPCWRCSLVRYLTVL